MKKKLGIFFILLLMIFLIGCNKKDNNIGKVFVDDENVKIKLVEITEKHDGVLGKEIRLFFEAENKTNDSSVFYVSDLTLDGKEISEKHFIMADEIAAQEKGMVELLIAESNGYFPSLTQSMKIDFNVYWGDREGDYSKYQASLEF